MVYIYKDADYDHKVTETVLEFENNDGKLYNEAMRDLSTAFCADLQWDVEEAKAFIFIQFYKMNDLTHDAVGVRLGAATEIVNGAVAEFELGNFWE